MRTDFIPVHQIEVLYQSGSTENFIVKKSEFGEHPNYLQLTFVDGSRRQILSTLIKGICYETKYLL